MGTRTSGAAGGTGGRLGGGLLRHHPDEVGSSYAVVRPPSGRFLHFCPQAPRFGELHEQDRRGTRSDFRRRFWRESGDGRRRGREREEAGFRRRDAGKRRISCGGACGTAAAPTLCGTLPRFGHGRSHRGRASREKRGPVHRAGLAVALLPRHAVCASHYCMARTRQRCPRLPRIQTKSIASTALKPHRAPIA